MALKKFNSVDGFSVGESQTDVIFSNADVTANNLSVTGEANLGPIGNVTITGGTSGQVLTTDGSGTLSFTTVATEPVTPGGSTGPVYDDGTTYVDTNFTNSGTKNASASLEGVYPIYAATVTTTVLTKQSLVSMLSGNNLTYAIVAENNPGEHTFALPDCALAR